MQELVSFRGHNVKLDGVYGPATAAALKAAQCPLGNQDAITKRSFEFLVTPLKKACELSSSAITFPEAVVEYAQNHNRMRPREIGGQNMGPWVRLYMDGNEGVQWPWCAGFATFVLAQAAATRPPVKMTVKRTFSCDMLASMAKTSVKFVDGNTKAIHQLIKPGDLFLVRRTAFDWVHTGIVVAVRPDSFTAIEGNTNDDGSREGYEVCMRIRAYKNHDFVSV